MSRQVFARCGCSYCVSKRTMLAPRLLSDAYFDHDETVKQLAADLDTTPEELTRHAINSVGAPINDEKD